jgi:hypothetical protein
MLWRLACLNLSGINTPHIPTPVILHQPAYEDGTDSTQTPGKHPKENISDIHLFPQMA